MFTHDGLILILPWKKIAHVGVLGLTLTASFYALFHTLLYKPEPIIILDRIYYGNSIRVFEEYLKVFSEKTEIPIQIIKSKAQEIDFKGGGKIPERDIDFNCEFTSAHIAFKADRKEPIEYVPVSKIIRKVHNMSWMSSLSIHYCSNDGKRLYALPFNPSMAIIYANQNLLKKAGIKFDSQKITWDYFYKIAYQLKSKGYSGFTFPWAAIYEFFGSVHNMYVTSHENGFFGDPQFSLHENKAILNFMARLFQATRDGVYVFVGGTPYAAEDFFAENTCGFLLQGSTRLETIKEKFRAKGNSIDFSFEALPFDDKLIKEPMAPKIGGVGLWVTEKGAKNASVKKLLKWLVNPKNQALWSRMSGNMAATLAADKILEEEGFYRSNPHTYKAVIQGRRPASFKTHMRIPKYDEIRGPIYMKHFEKAIEECLKTSKPIDEIARDFLYSFSEEANALINNIAIN